MLKSLMVMAFLLPAAASAQCRIAVAGTGCVAVQAPASPKADPVQIGATVARGEYNVLMNAPYYGLPTVSGGWVYMAIEDDIYRVDWISHEVLEKVTHLASRNW